MKMKTINRTVIASAIVHALLFFGLGIVPKPQIDQPNKITVDIVTPEENPNRELLKALQRLEKKMKLVEQKRLNEDKDEKAKFFSEHDQKVVKQTAAQKHGEFQNQVLAKQSQNSDKKENVGGEVAKEKPTLKSKELDLFGQKTTSERFKHLISGNKAQDSESQQPQTRDYLKGVDPGLQTLLSTREFVYFSYYNRIKNQLAQHWEPLIKDRFLELYRQGRQPAAVQDRITKVIITLDAKGILVKVQVVSESGIRDLDEAAVDAFRAAAPFPNPPKGIVESDGTIKIRWDFIIEA